MLSTKLGKMESPLSLPKMESYFMVEMSYFMLQNLIQFVNLCHEMANNK